MWALVPGLLLLVLVHAVAWRWPDGPPAWFRYRSLQGRLAPDASAAATAHAWEYLRYLAWIVLNAGITCLILDLGEREGLIIVLVTTAILFAVLAVLVEYRVSRRHRQSGNGDGPP
jgi:hypothetical protein